MMRPRSRDDVMPGLDPGIHVFTTCGPREMDGGVKSGHDVRRCRLRPIQAVLAVLFGLLASPAYADLKLCNRMSYVVDAAIGIDETSATATRGWFRIDPAQCRVVAQGTLAADRILLHARALGIY